MLTEWKICECVRAFSESLDQDLYHLKLLPLLIPSRGSTFTILFREQLSFSVSFYLMVFFYSTSSLTLSGTSWGRRARWMNTQQDTHSRFKRKKGLYLCDKRTVERSWPLRSSLTIQHIVSEILYSRLVHCGLWGSSNNTDKYNNKKCQSRLYQQYTHNILSTSIQRSRRRRRSSNRSEKQTNQQNKHNGVTKNM